MLSKSFPNNCQKLSEITNQKLSEKSLIEGGTGATKFHFYKFFGFFYIYIYFLQSSERSILNCRPKRRLMLYFQVHDAMYVFLGVITKQTILFPYTGSDSDPRYMV